jgi:Reverse transcriptase (RNA-dependent DNA polymerase)
LGVVAARQFAARRDVPDVLGFADYAADAEGTIELAARRFADDALFLDKQHFPLPKPSGGTRGLTVMNPIDEFTLRAYVGRCSPAIAAATYSERVLNGVIRRPGPSWFSADFREQSRRRRELQSALYRDDRTQAVAFFDVKDFFKSCSHDTLVRLLLATGAPPGAVRQLARLMDTLFPTGVGLPIGFEGSGPLANLFLDPVDRALLALDFEFVRWTDDLDVFLTSLEQWPMVHDTVEERLGTVGLSLNLDKVALLAKGPDAEQRLLDPGRDSIFEGDALENAAARLTAELWMRQWATEDEIPPAHLRSCLGLLRSKASPEAVSYLEATPAWIDREPRSVGDYLAAIASNPSTRGTLDEDWLIERAVGQQPTATTAAGQLHMCRALAEFAPSKKAGARLLDFAYDPTVVRRYAALGGWAIRAWSASRGWKPGACTDVLHDVGHLSYRRAAIAGFAGHSSASDGARLRTLARDKPDMGPAIRAVLTA